MSTSSRMIALLAVGIGVAITAAIASVDTGGADDVDAGSLVIDTDISIDLVDPLALPLDETGMTRP